MWSRLLEMVALHWRLPDRTPRSDRFGLDVSGFDEFYHPDFEA